MTARDGIAGRVVVAGVGYAAVERNSGKSEIQLTVEAAKQALHDSGMSAGDVDGLTSFPDRSGGDTFSGPLIDHVQASLGLNLRFWQAAGNGPAQLSCAIVGVHAILAGTADVVLCYRTVLAQPRMKVAAKRTGSLAWNDAAFTAPYGSAGSAPKWAMVATRYMHESGTRPEHLAAVAMNNRFHAQLNPRAVWHGQPLTIDEYYASPLVATPLRRVDCDMPIDTSVAIILARADRAAGLRHRPAFVEALACPPGPMATHDLMPDFTKGASYYVGKELWARTGLSPADVDVAQPYDGFSFQALQWLEDMGLAGRGEAGDMVAEGHCRVGGRLPICTDGGQLGVGRYHGLEKLAEAARQLWGGAGEAQVAGAEVSLACAGGGPRGAAILLTNQAT
ncbi:MAG: hypothetical protein JO337_11190 [Acidimicrobiales bacterium]|nr:hypothetical protein [Acidimicrobiales bacterium]